MRGTPLEEGQRWLEQARIDLGWAEHLAEAGAHHLACFLSQQVAEKALKALLYADGAEVVLGHSVERLCTEASEVHPSLRDGCGRWSVLDAFYVPTRYPNSIPDSIPARVFTPDIARGACASAREVVEAAENALGRRP